MRKAKLVAMMGFRTNWVRGRVDRSSTAETFLGSDGKIEREATSINCGYAYDDGDECEVLRAASWRVEPLGCLQRLYRVGGEVDSRMVETSLIEQAQASKVRKRGTCSFLRLALLEEMQN